MTIRLNIGCGRAASQGWLNYDNSPAVRLARSPLLTAFLRRLGLIDDGNLDFIRHCRRFGIRFADAARRIPHATGSVDAVYSSHMIEHLDRREARRFLAECQRVLRSGGRLRLVAPDLRWSVLEYMEKGRADEFIAQLQFDLDKPHGLIARIRRLLSGGRGHHWMYDGPALARLVTDAGFADVERLQAGQTRLPDPAGLDLCERQIESIYLEARRP